MLGVRGVGGVLTSGVSQLSGTAHPPAPEGGEATGVDRRLDEGDENLAGGTTFRACGERVRCRGDIEVPA